MRDPEAIAEMLYRLSEFRQWIQSNVLFPMVPDSIVHPLRDQLLKAEHELVSLLYDYQEYERVAAIQKNLRPAARAPQA